MTKVDVFYFSDYDVIFNQLSQVQGTADAKCQFIQDITKEALRFKKKILVEKLEKFEAAIVKTELRRNKTPNNNHVNNLHKPPSR